MNIFIYSMELITVPLDVYRSALKDIDEQTQAQKHSSCRRDNGRNFDGTIL